jgi:hypothetical protein
MPGRRQPAAAGPFRVPRRLVPHWRLVLVLVEGPVAGDWRLVLVQRLVLVEGAFAGHRPLVLVDPLPGEGLCCTAVDSGAVTAAAQHGE